jgi:hypothetical protein
MRITVRYAESRNSRRYRSLVIPSASESYLSERCCCLISVAFCFTPHGPGKVS